MRILVLTQVLVSPADAGPKIKTLQVLRHLASSHEVIYCTFVRSEKEERDARELGGLCARVCTVALDRSRVADVRFLAGSLLTGDSFLLRRDYRASMQALVARLLREERIDVLHVDQLNMMRFVPAEWPGTVILDEHNAVWQVFDRLHSGASNPFKRWFLGREARLIRALEARACQRAQVVLAVSEQDRRALEAITGGAVPIEVVPITVDAQRFTAGFQTSAPRSDRLLTIGTMFWMPNSEGVSWFLRQGYQHLRSLRPDLTYDIVGARPARSLQALAAGAAGVRLHGYVADAAPFWTHTGALAVPILSGGGVRVKILEAMAMGVPVVSTTIGCEGLDVRDGEHLLVADTPEAFASACADVLVDRQLAQRLTESARQLILERYDASVGLAALDAAYERGRARQHDAERSVKGGCL